MLLPASPFDDPQARRAYLQQALEAWDAQALAEAVVYAHRFFGWSEKQSLSVLRNWAYWCREQGYRWPHLPQNALLLFWEEITARKPPLSPKPLRKDATLYGWWRGLRRVLEVIRWAGLELPRLELPPRPRYALVRPYLSEAEFSRMLEAAQRHPEGRLRRLGVALLYLLGESGLWLKETFRLRLEDFDGKSLRVRGEKARTVPLSPEAARALRDYLEDREVVVGLRPLGSPYLFVRMTNRKGGLGRPLNLNSATFLLRRIALLAGVSPEGLAGRLRWRAVRRYLQQGLSPAEVAARTGLTSVAELGGRP